MTRRYKKMDTQTETPPVEPEEQRKIWAGPAVEYNPGHCPNCGSTRNKITGNQGLDVFSGGGTVPRIHKCCNCGTRFRSMQVVPANDVPFFRQRGGAEEEPADGETAQ